MKTALKHIEDSAQANGLLNKTVVVAVSGGRDSMLLLHLLQQIPLKLVVAHVNYGLREDASAGDAAFVAQYCKDHNLLMESVDVTGQYTEEIGNLQEWARDVRYRFFAEVKAKVHAHAIAVAHHQEDQAETILHQFLRGGGLATLRGMQEWTKEIWRPLLRISQEEILRLLDSEQVAYRQDASNLKNIYTRNKLRNQVSPILNEIVPGWQTRLVARGEIMSEVEAYLNEQLASDSTWYTTNQDGSFWIDSQALQNKSMWRYRLWRFLEPLSFSSASLTEIVRLMSATVGSRFENRNWLVQCERNGLRIIDRHVNFEDWIDYLPCPITPIEFRGWRIRRARFEEIDQNLSTERIALKMSALAFPIQIRNMRAGDRIQPFGMSGSKLISRLLIEHKIEQLAKQNVGVWCSEKTIFWVEGLAVSELCRAQPGDEVLFLEKIL